MLPARPNFRSTVTGPQDGIPAEPTLREGYRPAEEIHGVELPPVQLGKYSAAVTLTDIEKDHVLFNHAVLFTIGRLKTDPVTVYCAEQKFLESDHPKLLILSKPYLAGLPEPWSLFLWAVGKNHWPALVRQLDQISGINKDEGIFWKALRQQIAIPDYYRLSQVSILPAPLPMVPVMLFGLDGNQHCWHWKPDLKSALPVPVMLVKDKPNQETIQHGRAILQGRPNPFIERKKS